MNTSLEINIHHYRTESDFKVVHDLSTNHAFSEIHADPLKLSIDYM